MSKKSLIAVIIILLAVMALAVNAILDASKSNKNFREEMALRLDLEEKISKLEKEQSRLQSEMRAAQDALAKSRAEAEDLVRQLAKIQEEKAAFSNSTGKPAEPKIIPAS